MRAVDLFAGAGGFSLGLMRSGFDVVLANELSVEAEWTYRANLLSGTPEGLFPQKPASATSSSRGRLRRKVREQIDRDRADLLTDYTRRMRGGDIREVLPNSWLRKWREENPEEIDLLVAGPPCQGFSAAGRRHANDERNDLVDEALRVASVLEPKIVVIENVPGMLSQFSWRVEKVMHDLALGLFPGGARYSVSVELAHGNILGVPQTRRRLLVVGVREDLVDADQAENLRELLFPVACPDRRLDDPNDDWCAIARGDTLVAEDLLGDLLTFPPHYGSRHSSWMSEYRPEANVSAFRREMRSTRESYLGGRRAPDSFNVAYANHDSSRHNETVARRMRLLRDAARGSAEGRRNRCSSAWLREQFRHAHPELETKKASQRVLLEEEWPKLTVTSLPDDIVHYREDRIPTVREVARLQTFPDWFEFMGVRTTGAKRRRAGVFVPQYTQVANAVPPRLAFAVASRLRVFLEQLEAGTLMEEHRNLPGGLYVSPNKGVVLQTILKLISSARAIRLDRDDIAGRAQAEQRTLVA